MIACDASKSSRCTQLSNVNENGCQSPGARERPRQSAAPHPIDLAAMRRLDYFPVQNSIFRCLTAKCGRVSALQSVGTFGAMIPDLGFKTFCTEK